MTSLSTRLSFPLGLLLSLGTACAHRAATPAAETPAPSATVTSADLERQPGRPIEEVLMGRFPGVTVTRTSDGGVSVRIRGTTSLHASNEPLYVLDGVEIEPGPSGSLAGINPYDIASIEIVKDPAGEAMYGLRGANGVIIIKTKLPGR
jgi:TonB-dependent SusC/RagA subfamily outer membrane receptor